jgi:probable HAF family extracellular repeat protein
LLFGQQGSGKRAMDSHQKVTVMRQRFLRIAALLCGAATCASALPAAAQTYRITDLSSVVPGWTFVGMNNSGQLVGNYVPPGLVPQDQHGFIYANGTFTDIGTLVGATSSAATGINNLGQVTGTSGGHAFIYGNGAMTDIGTLTGGLYTVGNSINDSGQVTGYGDTSTAEEPVPQQTTHAFVYSNGTMTDLGTLGVAGGYSSGLGINDAGAVVGGAGLYGGAHPFLYMHGTMTDLTPNAPPDSGDPGTAFAYAINGSNVVVGQMLTSQRNPFHAFLYSNGMITDLSPVESCCTFDVATAINNPGQVLVTLASVANLYNNGVSQPLTSLIDPTDPLGAVTKFEKGVAINDSGWILAFGYNSQTAADNTYLLTPQTLSVSPAALSFGNQVIGTVSPSKSVTVTNTAAVSIPIASVATSGDFVSTNNCTAPLAPGASCTIDVTFGPTQVDARAGTLMITADFVYDVSLSGTGTITVTLSSSASTVTVGVPVTLTWASATGATCTATGGAAGDGWTGQLSASGTMAVTESVAGKYTYLLNCTLGSQSAQGQAVVTDTVPTVSLSANPTNLQIGQPTMLTWTSSNADSCTASSNGSGDGWTGTKPNSGTASITETTVGLITYTLTCTAAGQTVKASAQVFNNPRPSSGGGGEMSVLSITSLLMLFGLHAMRRRSLRAAFPSGNPADRF